MVPNRYSFLSWSTSRKANRTVHIRICRALCPVSFSFTLRGDLHCFQWSRRSAKIFECSGWIGVEAVVPIVAMAATVTSCSPMLASGRKAGPVVLRADLAFTQPVQQPRPVVWYRLSSAPHSSHRLTLHTLVLSLLPSRKASRRGQDDGDATLSKPLLSPAK